MYYKKEVGAGVVPASNNAAFPPPLVAPAPKDEMRVPPPVLFRLEAEAILHKRIKVEKKDDKLEFPPQPVEDKPYAQRTFAPMAVEAEPNFVCYGRLLFEEKNTERYGWDLGPIAPLLLAANFYKDYAALPYKVFSFPRLRYDCSAGLPLPGEPVPLLVYPPGLSVTGGLAEAGAIVALRAIIPRP